MAFTSGQWGPDTFIDNAGNTVLIGATVTASGYVCTVDSLGNLTITGPATDALTVTVTPATGAVYTATVQVKPLVAEIESKDAAVQAAAVQRANHTGTQAQSTVTNLVSDLAAKLDTASATATYGRKTATIDLREWNDLDLTGTNSSQSVMDAAVAQAVDGDTIFIPDGLIALTTDWVINKNLNLEGMSSQDVWPTRTQGFDRPTQAPFMRGAVLLQTAAAKNGITITGASRTVNLRNLGIRFLDRFANTGHGIEHVPPVYLTGRDHGLVGSTWDNVRVYGHDGDHYAYALTNELLNTFGTLRSYGGGVLHLRNDSEDGNYGNITIEHLYGNLVCGGTAHGIHLDAVLGMLNLLVFGRVQVNAVQGEAPATAPGPPQKFVEVTGSVSRVYWGGIPDFEGATSGMDTNYGTGPRWVNPVGIHGATANKIFNASQASAGGNRGLWSDMTLGGYSSQPLANKFNGAALGTGAPAMAESVSSDDWRGQINFGSGTGPTTGVVADIRYNKNRGAGNPIVFITPRNAATAALGLYVASETALGFTVGCTTAPAASQPAGTYAFSYRTER